MKRMLLIGLLLPLLFLLVRATGVGQKASVYREIDTGHELLCLPMSQGGLFSTPPLFSQLFGKADVPESSSFMVDFGPETAVSAIEGYWTTPDPDRATFLHATFSYLGEEQLAFRLASGPYSEGLRLEDGKVYVQPLEGKNAWRVSDMPWSEANNINMNMWNLYSMKPERGHPLPQTEEDYHIASCIGALPDYADCIMSTGLDGYWVEIDAAEPNALLKADIKRFLAGQLAAWRQNCQQRDAS